jgi:hypothetical protein
MRRFGDECSNIVLHFRRFWNARFSIGSSPGQLSSADKIRPTWTAPALVLKANGALFGGHPKTLQNQLNKGLLKSEPLA